MTGPTVSIGLPVWNGERFLGRAVRSILDQTYTDWELLISDNGSSDRTVSIASEFVEMDSRIRLRTNEANLGAVANFEVVFRETTGKYFMWLAYDDWVAPEYLETFAAVLDAHPDYVLAFAGQNVVDDSGSTFRNRTEPIGGASSPHVMARFHAVQWGLGDPTSPVFGLMRRSALEKTGLIPNSLEPDRILINEMALLGRIHQDPRLMFYHYGPPGHTDRANWIWLAPKNSGRPAVSTFTIVRRQAEAIWAGDHGFLSKVGMTLDLLAASVIKRTAGKVRAVRRQAEKRRAARASSDASQDDRV